MFCEFTVHDYRLEFDGLLVRLSFFDALVIYDSSNALTDAIHHMCYVETAFVEFAFPRRRRREEWDLRRGLNINFSDALESVETLRR